MTAMARCTTSFVAKRAPISAAKRLFSSTASDDILGISRLSTLQTILTELGAPGTSKEEMKTKDDLVPTTGPCLDLHPHLFPIAKSQSTGNYICGLRRAYADDAEYVSSTNAPWPIVEAKENAPGMRLLALNSEHYMRRLACAADVSGNSDIVSLYNEGLGAVGKGLDAPYESGSVEKLGYGLDKYVLLRVGPFPDLYQAMAQQHKGRGDESSALISAEAANGKFPGFGSTFASYAKLLLTFANREEEARDAARMCLRLPIPSAALELKEFAEIAVLAQFASDTDTPEEAMKKLEDAYEKIKEHEKEEDNEREKMTKEQIAIDEANCLLDRTAFSSSQWKSIRPELSDIYESGGQTSMARFVDPERS